MKNYDFIIGPTDTDSISFCKANMAPFSPEEQEALLKEINEISPPFMEWEDDGYYLTCIAIRAKNYILWDGKKKTVKGSAFKTSSKEPAMKELMQDIVDAIIAGKENDLVSIYEKYIKEALNVKDIRRWSKKVTISKAVLECEGYTQKDIQSKELRKNEADVWDAIKNESDRQEGNKVYLYPIIAGQKVTPGGISEKTGKPLKDKVKEITGLKMDKYWNNDHDSMKLVKRCYETMKIFKLVIDMDQFIQYNGKKNRELLNKFRESA